MRRGTIWVAAMLVVGACSGTTAETSTTSTAVPPSTVTTTSTAPTTTTTTTTSTTLPATTTTLDPLARPDILVSNFDRDSVDDFDTTGDDLYRVVMELEDLYDFFEGNPSGTGREMLGWIYTDEYASFDRLTEDLDRLIANDWRYVDRGTETIAIDVESVSGDAAIVKWASRRGDQQIADADGNVVKTLAGWDLDLITYRLERGADGHWRIAELLERLSPVPQQVIDSMVPVEWSGRQP